MTKRTGFVWHERYGWHDTGAGAGPARAGHWIEPGEPMAENAATKRRLRNLVDVSGLLDVLVPIKPLLAEEEQLLRHHTRRYVDEVRALSAGEGGQVGLDAYVGRGSFEIAQLSAGGAIAATRAVLAGDVDNAYALVRPPGHHAGADGGMGFCLFANIVLAIKDARATASVRRVAVIDWDVHHGNGTQEAFYDDPETLTISIHQDNMFPPGSGSVEETGCEDAPHSNLNIPLPPGSGIGAYRYAFERVIVPALQRFKPDLLIVACGFDAAAQDPLGRMLLTADEFAHMTGALLAVADDCCDGKLVCVHEGGYSVAMVPFCGLAVLETLAGHSTEVEDPFAALSGVGGQALTAEQAGVVDGLAAAVGL